MSDFAFENQMVFKLSPRIMTSVKGISLAKTTPEWTSFVPVQDRAGTGLVQMDSGRKEMNIWIK